MEATFTVPAKLAPVYLAFKIFSSSDSVEQEHKPARGLDHFAVPLGLGQCNPLLLGEFTCSLTTICYVFCTHAAMEIMPGCWIVVESYR